MPPHDHHDPAAEEAAHLLEHAFIDGYRAAADKTSFLRLARVPFETAIDGIDGFKLLEIKLCERFAIGAATPGFGTTELVYHPFPGALVKSHTELVFVYRTVREKRELDWCAVDKLRQQGEHQR